MTNHPGQGVQGVETGDVSKEEAAGTASPRASLANRRTQTEANRRAFAYIHEHMRRCPSTGISPTAAASTQRLTSLPSNPGFMAARHRSGAADPNRISICLASASCLALAGNAGWGNPAPCVAPQGPAASLKTARLQAWAAASSRCGQAGSHLAHRCGLDPRGLRPAMWY